MTVPNEVNETNEVEGKDETSKPNTPDTLVYDEDVAKYANWTPYQIKDKVDALHGDLHKERQTLKQLRAERETLIRSNGEFTIKEKKSDFLNSALSNLGEDFEIPGNKLATLNKMILKFADSDMLETDILEAVELVKTSKNRASQVVSGLNFGPAAAPVEKKPAFSFENTLGISKLRRKK